MVNISPFHQVHENNSAVMIERDGWLMPLHYGDPQAEHRSCHEHLAVFDTSFYYRIRVAGPDAGAMLDSLVSCHVRQIYPNRQRYAIFCNEKGGVIEDCIIQNQGNGYLLIGNPVNHQRMLNDLSDRGGSYNVKITDETFSTAMVTLKGPDALTLLKEKMPFDLEYIQPDDVIAENYFFMRFVISLDVNLSPTIILPAKMAGLAWDMLEKYGKVYQAVIAGMETRDSLRIEAGMPKYGHELAEDVDPFTAGLGHAVDMDGEFVGLKALRDLTEMNPGKKITGFVLDGDSDIKLDLPCFVFANDINVGHISSVCYSPTLQKHIALGYLNRDVTEGVDLITGDNHSTMKVIVSNLPFLDRQGGCRS
jgi:aminomethyltransferase